MVEQRAILLVEDCADEIELFRIAFREVAPQAHLTFVGNEREAIQLLQHAPVRSPLPDVIVISRLMPDLATSGLIGFYRSHEHLNDIPVVLMLPNFPGMATGGRHHADLAMPKPRGWIELQRTAERIIRLAG